MCPMRRHLGDNDISEKCGERRDRCDSELTSMIKIGEKNVMHQGAVNSLFFGHGKFRNGKQYHSFSTNRGIIQNLSSQVS